MPTVQGYVIQAAIVIVLIAPVAVLVAVMVAVKVAVKVAAQVVAQVVAQVDALLWVPDVALAVIPLVAQTAQVVAP